MLNRRLLISGGLASTIACPAFSQAYPTKTVRIVVPFTPGSPIDVAAREKLDLVTLPREAKRPAILRFDPRSPKVTGGVKGLGDYTIPTANRFASDGDPKTLGEIYAYGLRNTHRISWDTDGTMFGSDIGMSNIEEINILHEGANYGWMAREGTFENGRWRGGDLDQVFALPEDVRNGKNKDAYTYPVAMFDHGDGVAVSAGFAYHGKIEQLQGKFVFGDVNRGRIFVADVAAMNRDWTKNKTIKDTGSARYGFFHTNRNSVLTPPEE